VIGGKFLLILNKNEIITLSTLDAGNKGDHGLPPVSQPFPVPYVDTFEGMIELPAL